MLDGKSLFLWDSTQEVSWCVLLVSCFWQISDYLIGIFQGNLFVIFYYSNIWNRKTGNAPPGKNTPSDFYEYTENLILKTPVFKMSSLCQEYYIIIYYYHIYMYIYTPLILWIYQWISCTSLKPLLSGIF